MARTCVSPRLHERVWGVAVVTADISQHCYPESLQQTFLRHDVFCFPYVLVESCRNGVAETLRLEHCLHAIVRSIPASQSVSHLARVSPPQLNSAQYVIPFNSAQYDPMLFKSMHVNTQLNPAMQCHSIPFQFNFNSTQLKLNSTPFNSIQLME